MRRDLTADDPASWELHEPDLIRRKYDDVRVIFQRSAGKTHFLNETSALILEILESGPSNPSEVYTGLIGASADSISDREQQFIAMHMKRLEALGLLRRTKVAAAS